MDEGDGSGYDDYDEYDDGGGGGDDSDVSWKVRARWCVCVFAGGAVLSIACLVPQQTRRSACKLLSAVITSRPEMLRTMYDAFPDDGSEDPSLVSGSHARQLIDRFKVI